MKSRQAYYKRRFSDETPKSFAELSKITQIAIALIVFSNIMTFFTGIFIELYDLHLIYNIIEHGFWLTISLYLTWSTWVVSLLLTSSPS